MARLVANRFVQPVVCVQKEQDIASRFARTSVLLRRTAFRRVHNLTPVVARNLDSPIDAPSVRHNHLVSPCLPCAGRRLAYRSFFVQGRDDDRDSHAM